MEKFQISVKNLNNLWSFIKIYAVFVLNLCEEKFVWRKNDKYEVWLRWPLLMFIRLSRRRLSELGLKELTVQGNPLSSDLLDSAEVIQ